MAGKRMIRDGCFELLTTGDVAMRVFLLLPLIAVLGGAIPAAAAERIPAPHVEPNEKMTAIQQKLDIRYFEGTGRQKLDVFSPLNARDRPIVIFVHGGGWMIGDKNLFGLYRNIGRFFARHGIVAVMVNYRLSPLVKHPEHVRDVARAFAWVRKHGRDFGGDPDQIILAGHSAGAHLVALLATNQRFLQDPELKLQDMDRAAIRGVIAVSGVYRIPDPDEFMEMMSEMSTSLQSMGGSVAAASATVMPSLMRSSKNVNPFRMIFGDDPDVRKDASPIEHVRKGLPPFLLLHGEVELPGLRHMAHDFRDALQKAGSPVELCQIDGHSHNSIVFWLNQPDDPTAKAMLQFIARLKKPQP
jgi:arylformamidase